MATSSKKKMSNKSVADTKEQAKQVRELKRLLSLLPEKKWMVPHVSAALKVVDYSFAVFNAAATVKAPRGVKIGAVELTSSKGGHSPVIETANWMLETLTQVMEETSSRVTRKKK